MARKESSSFLFGFKGGVGQGVVDELTRELRYVVSPRITQINTERGIQSCTSFTFRI